MTVTIREVADAAGVSTATVSRALSGVQTVDPELVARVKQSAETLGYRANRVARALRRQSTQTVGLVIPDITSPFFPAVVQAIERELRRSGLSLLLCDAGHDAAAEPELIGNLFDQQIDGLLISPSDPVTSQPAVRLAASRVPVVQVGQRAAAEVAYVGVDQPDAMRQVVDHLRDQGCRRFAYLGPESDGTAGAERFAEFTAQVRPVDPGAGERGYLGADSVDGGQEAATRLLGAGRPLPDAIVCGSDQVAAGALRALRKNGCSVPGDIALTGFGDTALAEACDPPLTSVRRPLEDLGTQAAQELTAAIARRLPEPHAVMLKASLVVRESSRRRPLTR